MDVGIVSVSIEKRKKKRTKDQKFGDDYIHKKQSRNI